MKKILLLAACGFMATAASAQYQVEPGSAPVIAKGVSTLYDIVLSEKAVNAFKAAGAEEIYIGPDGDGAEGDAAPRPLYIWNNTFVGGDSSNPRVDMEEGGYLAFEVGTVGWSGAGICCNQPVDISKINDNTRFHIAYMTPTGNAPASIALILIDNSELNCSPVKVSLGESFNDQGAIYPTIGAKANDDWQGVDISFADLKKLYHSFSYSEAGLKAFKGNIFSFLGGGVQGTTFAFDAVYFYNVGEAGVEGVAADEADFVVTRNTVNVLGANGIELYNIAGQKVKATEGTTLGLTNLAKGIYVAKSGKKVVKVVVK